MTTTTSTLKELIDDAFAATCEAEQLIYAAGMKREIKDHIIAAHSALLALKNTDEVVNA